MIKKTRLAIFDFDGTLVRTQMPDEGKIIWEEKTGNKWPHVGWWGRFESLDRDVFEQPVIKETIQEYLRESADEATLMVMLTGRRTKLGGDVEAILADNDLIFDQYRYNYGGDTLSNKIKQITEILDKNKYLDYVSLYDDRLVHLPEFKHLLNTFIKSGRIGDFNLYHVDGNGKISNF